MTTRVLRLLVVASVLVPAPAAAQSPAPDPHAAQPERPTVATHAGTVSPGWFEIEAGTEFDRYADRLWGGSAPVLFKIGVAPRMQFDVQTPLASPPGAGTTGIGDASAGLKWRLLEHAPGLGRFAIQPSVKLPTGSTATGAGTGTTDLNVLLISSHAFGPIAMDVNVGYTRRSGDGSAAPRNATLWTFSFGGPVRGRLGWVGELYGLPATAGPAGARAIVAVLAGPTVQVRDWFVLDMGIIAPIAGPQPRAFYAGIVYNVGRLGGR